MDDFLNTTTCEEYYREPDSFASLLPCDYAIWENTDCTKCPYKSDCWDQSRQLNWQSFSPQKEYM